MFVKRLLFTQLDFTVVLSSQGWGDKGDETASLPSGAGEVGRRDRPTLPFPSGMISLLL